MKLFQRKPADERVTGEMNRIYKTGYLILTIGVVLDLYFKMMLGAELLQTFDFRSIFLLYGWEFVVFMGAQVVCLALMVRRGLSDDDQYADAEVFPLAHYVKVSLLAGLAAGAVAGGLMLYRFGTELWIAALSCLVMVALGCALGILALQYAVFRMAKTRRAREAQKWEDDE